MSDKTTSLFVVKITDNEDNTCTVDFQYDEDFKKWFLESQGLKRWSTSRFEKVVRLAIEEYATARGKSVFLENAVLDPEEENQNETTSGQKKLKSSFIFFQEKE